MRAAIIGLVFLSYALPFAGCTGEPRESADVFAQRFLTTLETDGPKAVCTSSYLGDGPLLRPGEDGPECDLEQLDRLDGAEVVEVTTEGAEAVATLTDPAVELSLVQAEMPFSENASDPALIWQVVAISASEDSPERGDAVVAEAGQPATLERVKEVNERVSEDLFRAFDGVSGHGVGAADEGSSPNPQEQSFVVVVYIEEGAPRPVGSYSVNGVAIRFVTAGPFEAL